MFNPDSPQTAGIQYGRRANGSIRLPNGPIFANAQALADWLVTDKGRKYYSHNRRYVDQLINHVPKLAGTGKKPGVTKIDGNVNSAKGTSPVTAATHDDGPARTATATQNNAQTAALNQMLSAGPLGKQLATIVAQAQKAVNKSVAPTLNNQLIAKLLKQSDPNKQASMEAKLAYGSTLSDLRSQLGQVDAGLPGVLSGLDQWYGAIDKSNQDAAAWDAETLAKNTAEAGDAAKAFIAAIGGSANPGSASVAGTAAINDANLRAMGQAESNFNSNMGQFFKMSGQSQRNSIIGDAMKQRAELARQLSDTTKEMGLYQAQQLSNYKNDNQGLALQLQQALYDQRKDAADTSWNRLLGLSNLVGMASTLPQQVVQGNLATANAVQDWQHNILLNQQERAKLDQFQKQYGGGDMNPFSALNPGSRANLSAQLMTNLLGPKGMLTVNPNQFLSTVRNRLYNIAGYKRTPATEKFLISLLDPTLVKNWNKYHPKQQFSF